MANKDPFKELIYFVSSMFHSKQFDRTYEQTWKCPYCGLHDESVNDHILLAEHIFNKHPNKFGKYADNVDNMLKNPIGNIEISINWFNDLVKDYVLSEQHVNDCTLCGYNPRFRGKAELREHFESKHRKEAEEVKEILKSMETK